MPAHAQKRYRQICDRPWEKGPFGAKIFFELYISRECTMRVRALRDDANCSRVIHGDMRTTQNALILDFRLEIKLRSER